MVDNTFIWTHQCLVLWRTTRWHTLQVPTEWTDRWINYLPEYVFFLCHVLLRVRPLENVSFCTELEMVLLRLLVLSNVVIVTSLTALVLFVVVATEPVSFVTN